MVSARAVRSRFAALALRETAVDPCTLQNGVPRPLATERAQRRENRGARLTTDLTSLGLVKRNTHLP
jgi:hypothetical protein